MTDHETAIANVAIVKAAQAYGFVHRVNVQVKTRLAVIVCVVAYYAQLPFVARHEAADNARRIAWRFARFRVGRGKWQRFGAGHLPVARVVR